MKHIQYTPKVRSIQATETIGQLDDSLWRTIRKLIKSKTSYFRKKDADKVQHLEEVLNLFHQIEGFMRQMIVKMINHTPTIARAIVNEALTKKD